MNRIIGKTVASCLHTQLPKLNDTLLITFTDGSTLKVSESALEFVGEYYDEQYCHFDTELTIPDTPANPPYLMVGGPFHGKTTQSPRPELCTQDPSGVNHKYIRTHLYSGTGEAYVIYLFNGDSE